MIMAEPVLPPVLSTAEASVASHLVVFICDEISTTVSLPVSALLFLGFAGSWGKISTTRSWVTILLN
jgi:hypothetical protein